MRRNPTSAIDVIAVIGFGTACVIVAARVLGWGANGPATVTAPASAGTSPAPGELGATNPRYEGIQTGGLGY